MSQFEELEKSKQTHITVAINQVTSIPCLIDGEIKTEEDWNTKVQFQESVNADNVIVWTYDKPEGITYAVVKAKQDELEAEYDALDYARKRAKEYPSMGEAIHAILDDDLENLQILRQTIKNKYPKP